VPPSIYHLLDQLCESIKAETSILKTLADLFQQEREQIVRGDLEAFRLSTKEKQILYRGLTTCISKREETTKLLCSTLDIDRASLSLTELLDSEIGRHWEKAELMKDWLKSYRSAANEVLITGRRTQRLLERSMEYVQDIVKMIAQVGQPPPTYSAKGSISSRPMGPTITRQL